MIEVFEMKGAAVEAELQLSTLEHRAILIVKDRKQEFALQFGTDRIPIDVEVIRERRAGAVLEDVTPPLVRVDVESHVVWDEVEDVTHVPGGERIREGVVIRFGPELWIELLMVADVVTVEAAWTSPQNRRCVAIRDAESVQILDDGPTVGECEVPIEL